MVAHLTRRVAGRHAGEMGAPEIAARRRLPVVKLAVVGLLLGAGAVLLLRGVNIGELLDWVLGIVRGGGPVLFFAAEALLPALVSPSLLPRAMAFSSAGLQAAIAAARNGHHVTVFEQKAEPGGQVRLAASVPNRAEFGDMIRNQLNECDRLGVKFEYGVLRSHAASLTRPSMIGAATPSGSFPATSP